MKPLWKESFRCFEAPLDPPEHEETRATVANFDLRQWTFRSRPSVRCSSFLTNSASEFTEIAAYAIKVRRI